MRVKDPELPTVDLDKEFFSLDTFLRRFLEPPTSESERLTTRLSLR